MKGEGEAIWIAHRSWMWSGCSGDGDLLRSCSCFRAMLLLGESGGVGNGGGRWIVVGKAMMDGLASPMLLDMRLVRSY